MASIVQLEYAIAVDTHRHFARAAKASFVTQPTLSAQSIEFANAFILRPVSIPKMKSKNILCDLKSIFCAAFSAVTARKHALLMQFV